PQNPDIVYVAAIGNPFAPNPERGVYRSKDGGRKWAKVLFISEKTGAVDLEFAPGNPDLIYASMWEAERKPWTIISGGMEGGLYKSSDGGDTWKALTQGLPSGLRGKSDLAVSAAAPEKVFALIEAPGEAGGVYRSDDRGESWEQVTDFQPIRNRPFYYNNLEAHPQNPDILWGMAEGFWKSEDGGKTWRRQTVPHGDNHDMWINPDNPDLFIQANDGGANVTLDGGQTWSTQHNQPTAELYQVDVSDEFPYRLYAGQQDNSTISVPSRPPRYQPGGHTAHWEAHGGCETGPAVPKPGDPDIVYANCKGRFGVYNRRTGQEQHYYVGYWNLYGRNPKDLRYRFQRVAPIHVSPHDPNRVYHTSQHVHVTEDGGQTWQTISPDLTAFRPDTQVVSGTPITIDVTGEEHFSTIYEIQESPHERGVIWVGANDGPISITRNNGASWKEVTPPGLGPHGRVQNIEVSPHTPSKAYAAILRYQLGDFQPYVFRTRDYGESWTRITTGKNGIPADYPVRVVREDPDREGLLYAGTEFGMFISFDDGEQWQPFQLDLPVTPITDIKLVEKDLVLSTMGRGFWILDNLTLLHELRPETASAQAELFRVRAAYRIYGGRGFGGRGGPEAPQYPDPGAAIDYYLSQQPEGEVELEILDAAGSTVARFSSKVVEAPEDEDEEVSMRGPRGTRRGPPRLEKTAGAHRFTWSLSYPGPWHSNANRSGQGGPMVPPGAYQARLTVGDWTSTQSFQVRMDPRVVQEGLLSESDVQAQAELALKVRDAFSAARRLEARLEEALEQSPDDPVLLQVKGQLVTAPVRYSPPLLTDQLSYLSQNLQRSDQRPGKDAYQRYEELNLELATLTEQLDGRTETSGSSGTGHQPN
ncbi:MAG: hypothetical protein V3T83_06170, partial [Acidobacteriota bacterium]